MQDYGVIMDVVGNVGALGIVFWLVHRTFSHTIPRLSKDFTAAIKEARDDFKEALRTQSTDFHGSLRYQQDYLAAQVAQEREHTTKIIAAFQAAMEAKEIRNSIIPAPAKK